MMVCTDGGAVIPGRPDLMLQEAWKDSRMRAWKENGSKPQL